MTRSPAVTFLVPCFKLAHVLPECLDSILEQTFEDFEILIMDDCSPDNTGEVSARYTDPRVRYVRNEKNLGHLRNYNAGIDLARGEYIWLISADDKLADREALSRYMRVLNERPDIGFAFSPGITIDGRSKPTGVQGDCGPVDRIIEGDDFLRMGIDRNPVCTPSVIARRDLYVNLNLFHLDMPFAGDWYNWLRFAVNRPVAYVARPGSCYRIHEGSYTHHYEQKAVLVMVNDEVAVRWRLRRVLRNENRPDLVELASDAIIGDYGLRLLHAELGDWPQGLSPEQFEASVEQWATTAREAADVRARAYNFCGDALHQRRGLKAARRYYYAAWRNDRLSPRRFAKLAVSLLGPFGDGAHRMLGLVRRSDSTLRVPSGAS